MVKRGDQQVRSYKWDELSDLNRGYCLVESCFIGMVRIEVRMQEIGDRWLISLLGLL